MPFLSEILSVDALEEEYVGNEGFLIGLKQLGDKYRKGFRRVRGDGNCFYRAFLFAYMESLLGEGAKKELEELQQNIKQSKEHLVQLGYSEVAIDVFWEAFVDYLDTVPTLTLQQLEEDFSEKGESNYLVWYCRLLTAGYLKENAVRFEPFVDGLCPGMSVAQFCASEVEPMGKECEQPQIIALAETLKVGIKIEYLDGRLLNGQTIQSHSFPQDLEAKIILLYRPGHYDILYTQ